MSNMRKEAEMKKLRERYMVGEGKTPRIRTKHIQKGGTKAAYKKIAKRLGREYMGELPGFAGVIGSGAALALGGNPNEAMADVLGSENIGAGSDKVGDMNLSRAEMLNAERKAIRAAEERLFLQKAMGGAQISEAERRNMGN